MHSVENLDAARQAEEKDLTACPGPTDRDTYGGVFTQGGQSDADRRARFREFLISSQPCAPRGRKREDKMTGPPRDPDGRGPSAARRTSIAGHQLQCVKLSHPRKVGESTGSSAQGSFGFGGLGPGPPRKRKFKV
jgi:hypothetical protein